MWFVLLWSLSSELFYKFVSVVIGSKTLTECLISIIVLLRINLGVELFSSTLWVACWMHTVVKELKIIKILIVQFLLLTRAHDCCLINSKSCCLTLKRYYVSQCQFSLYYTRNCYLVHWCIHSTYHKCSVHGLVWIW